MANFALGVPVHPLIVLLEHFRIALVQPHVMYPRLGSFLCPALRYRQIAQLESMEVLLDRVYVRLAQLVK